MSGNWFSNHGQKVQVAAAVVSAICAPLSIIIALSVAHPDILKAGLNGIAVGWPLVAVVALLVGFWSLVPTLAFPIMDRMAQRSFEKRFPEVRSSEEKPAPTQAAASGASSPVEVSVPVVEPKKPKIDEFDTREVIMREVKVNIGSYWEDKVGFNTLRIAVLGVDGAPGEQLVGVSFSSGGGMFHGGEKVTSPRVNQFLMPERNTGFQSEEMCVYNFSWSPTHVHFFVARVNGIDLHSREVAINFASVRLTRVPKD